MVDWKVIWPHDRKFRASSLKNKLVTFPLVIFLPVVLVMMLGSLIFSLRMGLGFEYMVPVMFGSFFLTAILFSMIVLVLTGRRAPIRRIYLPNASYLDQRYFYFLSHGPSGKSYFLVYWGDVTGIRYHPILKGYYLFSTRTFIKTPGGLSLALKRYIFLFSSSYGFEEDMKKYTRRYGIPMD